MLTTPFRRGCFLGGVVLAAAALIVAAGRYGWAERLARSSDPAGWERAAALEPGNAGHWHRLGAFYHHDFANQDLQRAIGHYRRALEINPRSAPVWMDLAGAYEAAGNPEEARAAYRRALAEHPISSEAAWHYGNFLLRQGELEGALAEIRRALETDPSLARLAVALTWRATGDARRVLREALPARPGYYREALDYFLSQAELEPALAAWGSLLNSAERPEPKTAVPLVDALLAGGETGRAAEVWRQALEAAGWSEPGAAPPAVWNGGFARDPVNGGFDWRLQAVRGARYGFDTEIFRSAPRSLRIRFDGTENVSFEHVWVLAPVTPGRAYRVQAYLRAEALTTDSGVQLWLSDAQDRSALDVASLAVTGTRPWALEELFFTAGPQTRLVRIALRRSASRKFDNKLGGTVWVDDVALVPSGSAGGGR